ncbi:alpha-acetolactate decarboxylase [Yersinia enterocolitica]|nr:alpha-acetolactate decarboxylase [Yersinia enterocolitica]
MSREQIHKVINDVAATDNLFCTLRIDGKFSHVETRTVPRQQRPYKPMLEAIAEQPTFEFQHQNGVIIGFRSPNYTQGINVAGYHEHFITGDRSGGGHVLDYQLENGILTFGTVAKLVIDLPQEPDFLTANLSPQNLNSAICAVES